MYLFSNNFILFIVIAGLVYLVIQLKKLQTIVKELESDVQDYIEFEHKVTLLGSNPKYLTEYFKLRNKHNLENITMIVMKKEEVDKIDEDALLERQKREIDELVSKERQSPDISFPAKGF